VNNPGLPTQLPLAQYTLTATMDARDALALALRRLVEDVRFAGDCQADRFAAVFDEWPSFNDGMALPAAAVLPGEFRYEAWSPSPHLLEETWEPKGKPGWGLYQTAEVACDFQLTLRTDRIGERPLLMRAIEDAFQAPGMLMDNTAARYGLMLPLPEYYGLLGRFAILAGSVIDNEDAAMREKRDAIFIVSARVPKVQVGPVWPMALQVSKTVLAGGATLASVLIG
jgi:hypothetical protein